MRWKYFQILAVLIFCWILGKNKNTVIAQIYFVDPSSPTTEISNGNQLIHRGKNIFDIIKYLPRY